MIVTNPFSPGTWSRDQIDTVSRNWWVLLLNGVVGIVAGGIILSTDWTVSELAVFVGAVLLVQGILTAFSVPLDGSGHAWAVALGLLEAFIGLAVWIWPGPTLLVVAFFIGWYVLFSGIVTIAGSISSRDVLPYWGFVLGFGILETLLSLWLLARPGLTLVTAILVLGLWALVYGIVQVVVSFEAKNLSARADRVDHELQAVTDPEPLDTAFRR